MLSLILLMLSCASKKPSSGPVTAAAPAEPPPPVLPACAGTDEDAPLTLADEVDLLKLASSRSRFTIEMPEFAVLAGLDEARAEALLTHLSADPAWRVHRRAGTLVAEQRIEGAAPASGYHTLDQDTWRALLRFDEWPADARWSTSPLVSTADAAEGRVVVKGFAAEGGLTGTAVSIRGPLVSVELLEVTDAPGRPRTVEAMSTLFSQVAWQSRAPRSRLTPDRGDVRVHLSGAEARGWLNPGQPGQTWLRLLDADGQPLLADAIACASVERIGWSDDPAERFYLQAELPDTPPAATVEAWFLPDGAVAPVRLYQSAALP